ncbi:hypothetical protein [Pseudoclavibacter sp. 8L]|uniref:hypothetical protein n=1 Tax=Pseudoclavibacter sp. 8L TaxID=2653162 RepID=UPI0012EEE694|nr:hypothetical protein [Pseudoclavibacter sp. 8L]VXB29154.1 hypothetical protein PSCLAVI8L_130394 [Pseudoclavibacter sp. 8L]
MTENTATPATPGESSKVQSTPPEPSRAASVDSLEDYVYDVWATTARYPGLDPTGVNNSRAAIQQAIMDTPVGGTLHLKGKFFLSGGSSLANVGPDSFRKSVSIDWSGAEIISDSTEAPFALLNTTPVPRPVSNVAVTSILMENTLSVAGVAFTVADTAFANEWKRGDIVKVIADDPIPGAEPGSGGREPRVGEYLPFHSISGSTIVLIGSLVDTFSTNVRLCKMDESMKIYMKCGKIGFSDAVMASGAPRNAIILRNLTNAVIEQPVIQATTGPMILNEGCYKTTISDLSANYGIDAPSINYSYGVLDKGSAYTRVVRPHGRNIRHLYTDDTSAIAANSGSTHAYGATMFAKIIDGSGQGSSASMFDVHHASYGVEFINCTARDSYFGFQLRGRMGRLVSPRASNCVVGGRMFNQSIGGETYDSTIVDWESDNCRTDLEVTIHPPGHPLAEQRQDSWFVIDGFVTRNTKFRGINARNASVKLLDYLFSAAPDMVDGGGSIAMRNSRISLGAGIEHDFSRNTSGTALTVIELNTFGFSVFESGPAKYRHPGTSPTRVEAYINSAGGDLVRCHNQALTQAPATIIAAAPVTGSYVDWSSEANTRSSAAVLLGTTSMASAVSLAPLGRSMKADLTAFIDPSGGNGSLAGLPAPQFDGQRLAIIHHGSSNTVSISHDTSTAVRRALIGNTGKSLTPGQSMLLAAIPGGVWKQVTPVA